MESRLATRRSARSLRIASCWSNASISATSLSSAVSHICSSTSNSSLQKRIQYIFSVGINPLLLCLFFAAHETVKALFRRTCCAIVENLQHSAVTDLMNRVNRLVAVEGMEHVFNEVKCQRVLLARQHLCSARCCFDGFHKILRWFRSCSTVFSLTVWILPSCSYIVNPYFQV